MVDYIGLAQKTEKGYVIFFPDFPGFDSVGQTLAQAKEKATETLIAHMAWMVEDGVPIPPPSSFEEILQLPKTKESIALMIPVITPSSHTQSVHLHLDHELLKAIDRAAADHQTTRTALLTKAAQRLLMVL